MTLSINVVALATFVLVATWYAYNTYRELSALWELTNEVRAVTIFRGQNTDSQVATMFINLIGRAQHKLEVYDDGNKMPESIYENDDVIAALKEKLDANEQFKAIFFFNDNDQLKLRKEFEKHPRVSIYAGTKWWRRRPRTQVHYRIIDDGLLMYISEHRHGAEERRFEVHDASEVPATRRPALTRAKFGKLIDRTHAKFREFKHAKAA